MKIIHTSDLHLDSPLTSKLSADKSRERRKELLNNFSRLILEAKKHGAEFIIIAGDLFDSKRISERAVEAVFDAISEASDVNFLYLPGNHDDDAVAKTKIASLANFHILCGDNRSLSVASDVTVTGITRGGKGAFDSLSLDSGKKNIVVMHGELKESASDVEHIPLKEAAGKSIDYLALGHYHSHSKTVIDKRGIAVYSGTPEGRGFDEAGECGYVLIDTSGSTLTHKFIPFATRKMHIIPLDISRAEKTADIIREAQNSLSAIDGRDLVRLTLVGEFSPELWRDNEAIAKALKDRFYYFEIKDNSRVYLNPEAYKNDKSLKGEFIRTVLADSSIDDLTKSKIIECGIEALMRGVSV